ncbi:MAG: methyltransferase domain-containing protein [Actinomycetes bacterium]
MHDSSLFHGSLFFSTYLVGRENLVIVDIGAMDVNGSLRQFSPPNCKYVGVDFESGPGVDVVIEDPYILPFENSSIDVVVSSSCFEHSEFFWLVFAEMQRILKPGGLTYINAPANGWVHQYPVDCFRFYPDAGVALQNWARRQGHHTTMVESFVGNRADDGWNDFVAVYVSGEKGLQNQNERMLSSVPNFTNGRLLMNDTVVSFNNQELLG